MTDPRQGDDRHSEAIPGAESRDDRGTADGDTRSRLSRRSFLRGTATAALAAPFLSGCAPEADAQGEGPAAADAPRTAHGVALHGPGASEVTLSVNGEERTVTVEPRVTLLDALRGPLDLTGAKRVCDRGTCGACTVLMDGLPVYACSILAIAAAGTRLETVESLGEPEALHPLQAAFVAHDAQQCGFCTPGFVVAGKALLDENPAPSPDEVMRGLSGNFCRCGTYDGLKRAVAEAAGTSGAGREGGSDRG